MELTTYFSEQFNNKRAEIERNTLVLNRLRTQLDSLLDPTPKNIEKADDSIKKLLKNITPTIWNTNVKGNKEVEFETSFNELLISVCSELNMDSDKLTTFDFYNAVALLMKRHK